MQSKRALYKPACHEVGTREKRKPLPQGRLFLQKGPTVFSSEIEFEKPSNQDLHTGIPATRDQSVTLLSSPCQGSRHVGDDTRTGDTASQMGRRRLATQSSETSLKDIPRYETPQASFTDSPMVARPSHSLELSDSDSDMAHRRNLSEVLLVDATRQTKGPDESEVDIQVGYVHSPAKVICHATASHKSSPEGDVTRARQIDVDLVPAMKRFDLSEHSDESEVGISKSPQSKPQDKPRSHRTAALGRNNCNNGDGQDGRHRHQCDDNMAHRTTSRSISQMAEEIKEKVKKTKKAIRVSSRYMQTAKINESRGPMKATDRGIMGKVVNSRLGRSGVNAAGRPNMTGGKGSTPGAGKYSTPTRGRANSSGRSNKSTGSSGSTSFGGVTRKASGKKSTATSSSFSTQFSSTPEVRGHGGSMSTPSTDTSMFHAPDGVDLSAIGPPCLPHSFTEGGSMEDSRFHQSAPRGRGAMDSMFDHSHRSSGSTRMKTSKESGTVTESMMESSAYQAPHHTKAKSPGDVSQWQLDLKHARYIQWVFLESKLRKAFQEQDREAMKEVHALWQATQELTVQSTKLDIERNKQKHLKNVDESLNLQLSGLCPIAEVVGRLTREYETLAAALDTTRHQVAVKGISVPHDQQQFADGLQRALCETQQLLGELSHMTRQQTPSVTTFSETISAVKDTVSSELQELARCQELMSAASSLATHEASLLIQGMQSTAS